MCSLKSQPTYLNSTPKSIISHATFPRSSLKMTVKRHYFEKKFKKPTLPFYLHQMGNYVAARMGYVAITVRNLVGKYKYVKIKVSNGAMGNI